MDKKLIFEKKPISICSNLWSYSEIRIWAYLKFHIHFEILTSKVKLSQKIIWPDIHPIYNFTEWNNYLVKKAIWFLLDQNIHKLRKSNWFQVVNFCKLIFLPHAHTIIYEFWQIVTKIFSSILALIDLLKSFQPILVPWTSELLKK